MVPPETPGTRFARPINTPPMPARASSSLGGEPVDVLGSDSEDADSLSMVLEQWRSAAWAVVGSGRPSGEDGVGVFA